MELNPSEDCGRSQNKKYQFKSQLSGYGAFHGFYLVLFILSILLSKQLLATSHVMTACGEKE